MDILETIVENKRRELLLREEFPPIPEAGKKRRSLREALLRSESGIIAEFKRKSPSKAWIHENISPENVVPLYEKGGAAALSILTDAEFFGGELRYIARMRPIVDIPILRKDFIIDPVQIDDAFAAGADAVLLIAACLTKEECALLTKKAHSKGLEVLLEVHSPKELDYIQEDTDVVGVNNRNLGTFITDVGNSFSMAPLIKGRFRALGVSRPVMISESGISSPETVRQLRKEGFRGFLMGENFMKREDPGKALKEFITSLQ
ncbi:MAG: indole-3-glycerol phosphate synthase TrpC [Bacteroidales bacterium]|nr:indole-3-glycerol phosphate synthase TrpC [Bacteroidales bacterium]